MAIFANLEHKNGNFFLEFFGSFGVKGGSKDFPFLKGAFKPFGINIKISWKKEFFFFLFP